MQKNLGSKISAISSVGWVVRDGGLSKLGLPWRDDDGAVRELDELKICSSKYLVLPLQYRVTIRVTQKYFHSLVTIILSIHPLGKYSGKK
jgi:hypothetical protein